MRNLRLPILAIGAALLCGSAARGQTSAESPSSAAYRVGPGDVLDIKVYDDPDLSGLVTVQYAGDISFPLLGDVPVDGMTVKAVQETLVTLLAKDYLVDPQVIVRVKEHRSQWVTLVGEVIRPGKYYLQGSKSLLDLLTEAGGFTAGASGEVVVTRLGGGSGPSSTRSMEDGDQESESVRLFLSPEQSAAEQQGALSLTLRHGDIVTATSTQFFYISGEVKKPGSYPITAGLTILKAVSVAGGLTKFGGKSKVEILRKQQDGASRRIRVDLEDIERGKKPDVPLEAEDIVKVGKRVF